MFSTLYKYKNFQFILIQQLIQIQYLVQNYNYIILTLLNIDSSSRKHCSTK